MATPDGNFFDFEFAVNKIFLNVEKITASYVSSKCTSYNHIILCQNIDNFTFDLKINEIGHQKK